MPASTITPDDAAYDYSKNSRKKKVAPPVCLMHTLSSEHERYITAAALYRWKIAYRWRIVSQDIHHHSSTKVLSFTVTLDPNEIMPAPSRRNVFFSGAMLTLVCPFIYIYTWASIHTTSMLTTSTEVLSIVLHTCFRDTQLCLVCRLKGKTLLLPPHKKREDAHILCCLLYTSPSPRDKRQSRMPSSA